MKITKNTTIGELLEKHPEAVEILNKYMGQVGCITCPGRMMETLEMGAMVHGIPEKDFKKMLKELKDRLNKK
ncbi:MAG: DUF1858 domain-containing protein [Patescibacteria group bacterium]